MGRDEKPIHDAATVVVVRDEGDPFQIFMLRRHGGHEFMANAWVFPGGRLDEADCSPQIAEFIPDLDPGEAARKLGGDLDGQVALGLHVAALRETFEEAGLLLARRADSGDPLVFGDPELREHFDELRGAVDSADLTMFELCRREGLLLEAEGLAYLAHWITPDFESRRYDTRFFAALAPAGQVASCDDGETTQGAWTSPQGAIERYRAEEILLAPPTLRILEELSAFSSPDELFDNLRRRDIPPTILPHPHPLESGEIALLLPGDPEYPTGDPKLAAATPIEEGVTRIVRRGDQWFSVFD